MARYLIHCYKDRRWYVDKYLIPSMLKQDIDESDIEVFEDDGTLGCLEAFMQSCSRYCAKNPAGLVYPKLMWYSFPCIYIPDTLAREFATWFYRETIYNPEYKQWVAKRKYEDSIFQIYLQDYYGANQILNLAPNIVNHIDYLLGGSLVNKNRCDEVVHATYWEEPELLKYWEDVICR